jgi:membrane protease YdiL (CAAX protease family)
MLRLDMEIHDLFIGPDGHLRSGWRLAIFVVAFLICLDVAQPLSFAVMRRLLQLSSAQMLNSKWWFFTSSGSLLFSATAAAWACGALLEGLPFRALGATPHRGWLKNIAIGSIVGIASLFLAALFAMISRGVRFQFDSAGGRLVGETLATSLLIFLLAAAAEEMLFRGYPLQTLTRANLAWLGVLLTSVPFALAHLNNPNAVPAFTFINTALAGLWLAVAYLRSRSLWLPFALHWSWNWAQASLLGLPVSGIQRFAPAPLLHATNAGPAWLTGGTYGIEGGAACTVALIVSILVIWRTKLIARADRPNETKAAVHPQAV